MQIRHITIAKMYRLQYIFVLHVLQHLTLLVLIWLDGVAVVIVIE